MRCKNDEGRKGTITLGLGSKYLVQWDDGESEWVLAETLTII